jgi:hypothetical protein
MVGLKIVTIMSHTLQDGNQTAERWKLYFGNPKQGANLTTATNMYRTIYKTLALLKTRAFLNTEESIFVLRSVVIHDRR